MGRYERWYFDSKIGTCKTFTYGGCVRNKNNHLLESDCINSCVKPKQNSVCLLPKIAGNCDQKINVWYYDFKEGTCKSMVYSGCNGDLNRFESLEACEYTCQGLNDPGNQAFLSQILFSIDYFQIVITAKKELIISNVCHASKSTGLCHINLQRWYFNETTMMCHQFTYSGI